MPYTAMDAVATLQGGVLKIASILKIMRVVLDYYGCKDFKTRTCNGRRSTLLFRGVPQNITENLEFKLSRKERVKWLPIQLP